jgi:phage head maturation protease
MDKKSLARFEVKDETKGEVEAVFATLNVKDHDDDVTKPGAFENGAQVVISAYNHKSWEGALPVGTGTISEEGDQVVMKGRFFLNTTAGRDTFEVVKELGPRQEWSYGFNVDDSERGEHEGKSVRILKKMTVHEVSPVLRGAGLGTTTRYAKSLKDEVAEAVDAVTAAIDSAERVVALRAEKGKSLSNVATSSLDGLKSAVSRLDALLNTKSDDAEEGPSEDDINTQLAMIAADMEL